MVFAVVFSTFVLLLGRVLSIACTSGDSFVCVISNITIEENANAIVLEDERNLILENSYILVVGNESYLLIHTPKTIRIINSSISAKLLNISADIIEVISTNLSSDGTVGRGQGSADLNQSFGNAFSNRGADCHQDRPFIDKSYGYLCNSNFFKEDPSYLGSGGDNPITFAGGAILISANSKFSITKSQISSSGFPLENFTECEKILRVKAGTGGSIFILAELLEIDAFSKIKARGGNICNSRSWGGSGGRVIIQTTRWLEIYSEIPNSIDVRGGRCIGTVEACPACAIGGSGSFCMKTSNMYWITIDGYNQDTKMNADIGINLDKIFVNKSIVVLVRNKGRAKLSLQKIDEIYIENQGHVILDESADGLVSVFSLNSKILSLTNVSQIWLGYSNKNLKIEKVQIDRSSFMKYSGYLQLITNNFFLGGSLSALIEDSPNDYLYLIGIRIEIGAFAIIKSIDKILIYGTNLLSFSGNVVSNQYSCKTDPVLDNNLFFDFISNKTNIYSLFKEQVSLLINSEDYLNDSLIFSPLDSNYTLLLISDSKISFERRALLIAARIGAFAPYVEISNFATISANGMGCLKGLGEGYKVVTDKGIVCAGAGGSYAGKRGYGFADFMEGSQDCIKSNYDFEMRNKSGIYGDFDYPLHEGSGGGFDQEDIPGGRGGGFIYIGAFEKLTHNGTISADGVSPMIHQPSEEEDLSDCRGSGSGGSVIINTKTLSGHGLIEANGGDSLLYKCGEGGGGRIKIYLSEWQNKDSYKQNQETWYGKFSIEAGNRRGVQAPFASNLTRYQADDGTINSSPCLEGYFPNPLCMPCPEESFNNLIGYTMCEPCRNKPESAEYINVSGWHDSNCPYKCRDGWALKHNPSCHESFYLYVNFMTGYYGLGSVIFLLSIILIGSLTGKLNELRLKKLKLTNKTEISLRKDMFQERIISEELREREDFDLFDLLFHAHRISVFGTNRYDNRWFINTDPPGDIEYLVVQEKYQKFALNFNKISKWNRFEAFFIRVLGIAYYPLFWWVVNRIRKKKFQKIAEYVNHSSMGIWRSMDLFDLTSIKMKISCSDDYTLCFLDIFNYRNTTFKYFTLNCPYSIVLAGEGNFLKPFHINEEDPFIRALYISFNINRENSHEIKDRPKLLEQFTDERTQLENNFMIRVFIRRFNKLASTVDFSGTSTDFLQRVSKLCSFMEVWNNNFFKSMKVKVDFMALQIPKEKFTNQQNSVTIFENSGGEKFQKFIFDLHKDKILYSLYDIRFGLFIYDPLKSTNDIDNVKISFADEEEQSFESNSSKSSESDIFKYKENLKHKEKSERMVPLIEITKKNPDSKKKTHIKILKFIRRYMLLFRWMFFSHRKGSIDKSLIYFTQTLVAILDSLILSVLCLDLALDFNEDKWTLGLFFPLATLISPVLMLFWVSGHSYFIGKLALIFNFMAILNWVLNLIITFSDFSHRTSQIALKVCTLSFKILMAVTGSHMITEVKNLH